MKQMKIALMAMFAVLMGTTFISCLDSKSESSWDGYTYATVGYSGTLTLDNNLTFVPSNPSILRGTDGSMPERIFFYYKFKEGEVISESKTTYDITIVEFAPLVVRQFCGKDTLSIPEGEGQAIQQFITNNYWGANGYVNIGFVASIDSKTGYNHFDMYPDDVKEGVLYLKLHHNQKVESGSPMDVFMNFKSLSTYALSDALGDKYNDLAFTSDSVKVIVVADSGSGSQIQTEAVKMKVIGY